MKLKFFIISVLVVLLAACESENDLRKSVMIEDKDKPDLPEYSEWGYNTFGAYYDERQPFISNDDLVPIKVYVTDAGMSFSLYGQIGTDEEYKPENKMVISFVISDFKPSKYKDLLTLDDTVFNLSDAKCKVYISYEDENIEDTIQILSGELEFIRAQNLIVDKKEVEVILSGVFHLRAWINGEPKTISEGRFDAGISDCNFYPEK